MVRASSFLQLIRPLNCAMMGLAVIVGASLVSSEISFQILLYKISLGFVTAFTFTGASMAANDYFDREIDAINEPDHPIPSGKVSSKESLVFAGFLTIIGLISSILSNSTSLVIAIIVWFLMMAYNTKGKSKGLIGNLLVSTCVSISLIYGGVVLQERLEYLNLVFAVLAFVSNMGREINKGIVDVDGDKAKNVLTVAVSHGESIASYLASIFYLSAVILSSVPLIVALVSYWYIPFVIISDIGFILSSFSIIRDHSRSNARRIKNSVLIWMAIGLLAFLAGSLGQ